MIALSQLRQTILKESRRLFIRAGYRGASVRKIAEASACNVAAVYYHFGSKEKLFGEVLATYSPPKAFLKAIRADPPPPDGDPAEAVRHLAATMLATVRREIGSLSLMLSDIREFEGANLRRELGETIGALMADGLDPAKNPVGHLLTRLPLRPGLDPVTFMRILVFSVVSTAIFELFGGLPGLFPAGLPFPVGDKAALDLTCDVVLYGALRKE